MLNFQNILSNIKNSSRDKHGKTRYFQNSVFSLKFVNFVLTFAKSVKDIYIVREKNKN